MGEWRIRLRDWWRGYTNEDLASAMRKMEAQAECLNGGIGLTWPEYKAWRTIRAAQRDMEGGR